MSVKVECENCGELVEKLPCQVSEHNFCSRSCSAEWHSYDRVELTCDWCGDTFQKLESQIRDHNFCSKECNNKWISNQKNMATCEWCGEEFHKPPKDNKDHDFCCHEHYAKWLKGRNTGEDHPNYTCKTVECDNCGSEIVRPKWHLEQNPKGNFCDHECYSEWLSDNVHGSDHPNWTGGNISYYGPNWSEQRRKALERDNYTCQNCQETDEEKRLHVHHIIKFKKYRFPLFKGEVRNVLAEFDWKRANRLENLITLCSECHPKIENNPDLLNEGGVS